VPLRDLDKALADIVAIRSQIAAGTAFRGYGSATMAATAVVALLTAVVQHFWLEEPGSRPVSFFLGWAAAAVLSSAIILIEMRARTRRHHGGLADAMIHQAVEQFLPAAVAGLLIGIVIWQFAPDCIWMVPGLGQILVSLGIFASARSMPRSVMLAAVWYFLAGFLVLVVSSQSHVLSPWTMGLPFVIGQLLMASILHVASEDEMDG